jgi:hypothetical protein
VDEAAALGAEGLVIIMRIILSTLGLPLLLLACTPKVRPDPSGSGGAGGSGGATSTGTTTTSGPTTGTGTGGSGGSGGSVPTGICTKSGSAFDILSTNDLGAGSSISSDVRLVADQQKHAMVHVVVTDYAQNRIVARTVVDDVSPLGGLAQFGAVGTPSFQVDAVWGSAGYVRIEGSSGNAIEELGFPINPDTGVGADGAIVPFATPTECQQGGYLSRLVFAQDGSKARYLAVCGSNTQGSPSLLFAGGWSGQPVQLASDLPDSTLMLPQFYSYANGTHLAFFSSNDGKYYFSYGAGVDALTAAQPFRITADVNAQQGVFATAPLPADQGVALFAAQFTQSADTGQFWTGSVLAKDYGTLSQVPPPGLALAQDIPSLKTATAPINPTWNETGIFGAGSAGGKTLQMFWLTRKGKPLVFGQEVYTTTDTTIQGGNAAPFGDSGALVVWVERIETSPPQYLVRGQKMTCK